MDSYDFATKALYRTRREVAIDRMLTKHKSLRRVAYLDTGEALDTISYLGRGYKPENLWAINRNPAECAHLSMTLDSLGLPRVNTVGLDFEDALERRVPEVDVVDFDGTGNINHNLFKMLSRASSGRKSAVFGLTLLGGREGRGESFTSSVLSSSPDKAIRTSFGTLTSWRHHRRMRLAVDLGLCSDISTTGDKAPMCVAHVAKKAWDVYVSSSRQPMIWVVVRLQPHEAMISSSESNRLHRQSGLKPFCAFRVEELLSSMAQDDRDWRPSSFDEAVEILNCGGSAI